MAIKTLCRAWIKGDTTFPSVFGVKDAYAWELLVMKDICMPLAEAKKLDLHGNSSAQISRITIKEASKYLETHGWKWIKWSEKNNGTGIGKKIPSANPRPIKSSR